MVEEIITGVFDAIGVVTEAFRGIIISISPNYLSVILLVLAGLLGWWLVDKYGSSQTSTIIAYTLAFFLLLRFV